MPWLVPSHQALVLPLKRWRPQWFSGFALCLGSLAPDLEFIVRLGDEWVWSHTVAAQVYLTVPLVLALHWISTVLVLPWLLPRLPVSEALDLQALGALRPVTTLRGWATVAVSGALGGLTHVAVDGFTHGNHSGWALPYFPVLATPVPLGVGTLPLHDALQVALTVVLGGLALQMWKGHAARLRRAGADIEPVPARTRRTTWASLLLVASSGMAFALVLRGPSTIGDALRLAAFGGLTFLAGAVLICALWARARAALRRRATGAPAFEIG